MFEEILFVMRYFWRASDGSGYSSIARYWVQYSKVVCEVIVVI